MVETELAERIESIVIYSMCTLIVLVIYRYFFDIIIEIIHPYVIQYGAGAESMIVLVLLLIGVIAVIIFCLLVMQNVVGTIKRIF